MRYSPNKDLNEYLTELVSQGWNVAQGRKHLRLSAPSGGIVFTSLTPSDHRALANIKRDVRRVLLQGEKKYG